jgi:formate dehydrogenase
MALCAAGAEAAADGGQRRRGRARHLQDRYYLETDRTLSRRHADRAWAAEAEEVYIYLRDDYPQCREILEQGDRGGEAAGLAPHTRSTCGAAPAPISAARNRRCWKASRADAACRATSRLSLAGRAVRPADPDQQLRDLFWVRDIVEKRAGVVHRPGAATAARGCAPSRCPGGQAAGGQTGAAGITARELIDEFCAGMADGHQFKG